MTGRHQSQSDSWGKANFILGAANAIQLLNINQKQKQFSEQLSIAERQNAERSYAHWRQTPDGQAYETWKARVSPTIVTLIEEEQRWNSAWNKLMNDAMTPEEAKAEQTGDFISPPRKHEIVKKVLFGGFCILGIAFVLGFKGFDSQATGLAIIGFYGGILGALFISIFGRKMPFWVEENNRAREQSRIARAQRLGISPQLVGSKPISPWQGEGTAATRAAELIANEVVHHPLPHELIEVPVPDVIPDSDIPFEQLKPLANEIRVRVSSLERG